jgi:hypothetical protein
MDRRHWEGTVDPADSDIRLLKNEVSTLSAAGIINPFTGIDSITPEHFNAALGERLGLWLGNADREYRRLSNLADMSLDNYISNNKAALDVMYNDYHNDKLEEIMRKVYEKNKMLEYRERLVQNVDLIYLEPAAAGPLSFRTHFMAPVKRFMGYTIDTYKFNILLLLSSLIIFYIMLYTEALRRFISRVESLRFQKKRASNRE